MIAELHRGRMDAYASVYEKARTAACRSRSQMPRTLPHCRSRAPPPARTCFAQQKKIRLVNHRPSLRMGALIIIRRPPIPVPTLPSAATKTVLSVPWCALVEASSVSFASAQARKLIHSAASPLPAKSFDFAGDGPGAHPQGNIISRCLYSIVGANRHI